MSDMKQRVALAIAKALGEGLHYNSPAMLKAAEDAIAAMREPTAEMVAAGQDKMFHDDESAVPEIFRAMIDKAIEG